MTSHYQTSQTYAPNTLHKPHLHIQSFVTKKVRCDCLCHRLASLGAHNGKFGLLLNNQILQSPRGCCLDALATSPT